MPPKKKPQKNVKRLAKSISKNTPNTRPKPRRKSSSGTRVGGDARREVENARSASPLAGLIQSLGQEKIRFQIVGMTAAVMQGVLVTTLDTDIWVDLPERQYVRLMNLCIRQGGTALARTLYALSDGRLVNFLFRVNGIGRFAEEYKNAVTAEFEGVSVKVLPLERILKSKKTVMRDKDKLHILLIERVLTGRKLQNEK